MLISNIKIGKRFRKDIGNLASLKKSIEEIGLLHPIVVDEKGNLIAGFRRLKVFQELKRDDIPVTEIHIENVLRGEFDENSIRKDFVPSEAVAIWNALESYQGQLQYDSHRSQRREKASQIIDMGTQKLSRAKQVIEYGNKKWIEEMDRTGNVNKAYRYIKQKHDEQKILKEHPELKIKGKFKTILIDPPWQYDTNVIGRTTPEYATMSIEELQKISLPSDNNCHLYLWTTNAFLPKALNLGVFWGFEYKTCITWIKPSIGMGSYFRNSTEHCLFFVKGNLSTRVKNIPTYFKAKRLSHSEKPEKIYEIIEKASFPPYVEFFARKERNNWSILGNI